MTNYPSNLTDNQWNLIKHFLPKSKTGGYERKHLKREMLNAIFYLNKTACQWRYLSAGFAPRKSNQSIATFEGLVIKGILLLIFQARILSRKDVFLYTRGGL